MSSEHCTCIKLHRFSAQLHQSLKTTVQCASEAWRSLCMQIARGARNLISECSCGFKAAVGYTYNLSSLGTPMSIASTAKIQPWLNAVIAMARPTGALGSTDSIHSISCRLVTGIEMQLFSKLTRSIVDIEHNVVGFKRNYYCTWSIIQLISIFVYRLQ